MRELTLRSLVEWYTTVLACKWEYYSPALHAGWEKQQSTVLQISSATVSILSIKIKVYTDLSMLNGQSNGQVFGTSSPAGHQQTGRREGVALGLLSLLLQLLSIYNLELSPLLQVRPAL
jgi:hypothetical protein